MFFKKKPVYLKTPKVTSTSVTPTVNASFLRCLLFEEAMIFAAAKIIASSKSKQRKKLALTVGVTLVLVTLGVFKYTGFFLKNIQLLTGVPKVIPEIALPIGISFYSFQLISYVVDVYRGDAQAQEKYWLLLLYAGLFHQCIAGPIVRYRKLCG